jgi:hypothetical protein
MLVAKRQLAGVRRDVADVKREMAGPFTTRVSTGVGTGAGTGIAARTGG